MRAMTFNVLMGGGSPERFSRICEVISQARPDVLVLQECLGWEDNDRLAQVAAVAGLPHTYLGKARPRGSGRRFHVALLSRLPLVDVRLHNDATVVGHCVVEARLDWAGEPLWILGTHFDSHGEDLRTVEAQLLCARMPDGLGLVLGDLNALSPRDPYPSDLSKRLHQGGIHKYGHPLRLDAPDRTSRVVGRPPRRRLPLARCRG